MSGTISIFQEASSEVVRGIDKLVRETNSYYFHVVLNPPFSPHEQFIEGLTVRTSIDKILDDHAILKVSRTTTYASAFFWRQKSGEPILREEQYGCVDISDAGEIDWRLYERILDELEHVRKRGYQFEVDDQTKFAQHCLPLLKATERC